VSTRTTIRQAITVTLFVSECPNCGVLFGVTEDLEARRREDHKLFYCPNGHGMSFYQETEAERLRRELRSAEITARNAKADADWFKGVAATSERRLSATRGVVTKLRKRAHAGACPFGCRRHFVDLERHVASKHPGSTLDGES
jgi:hypothetical protein